MNLERAFLNVRALPDVRSQYGIYMAKKEHVASHPECAVCGNQRYLEAHHVHPVHLFKEEACDMANLITLCDAGDNACHRWIGHFGSYPKLWNKYVREYALASRLFLEQQCPHRKFIVQTDKMSAEFAAALDISSSAFLARVRQLYAKIFRPKL